MMPAALRLMRFDKPVGLLLLWAPTAWALWLANDWTKIPIGLICLVLAMIITLPIPLGRVAPGLMTD